MNLLDLFSGIGGFSLGLERAGFRTVAFCEVDPFCRRVLAKHWPGVPCYDDVRTLTADRLAADGIAVDAICGGFPCQDISNAGKRAGIEGKRSGLWSEYARLIGELQPRYVIVENVAALLGRGLGRVLGDVAALGFDAEWHCIPASALGAPHRRDRLWLIAHAYSEGLAWDRAGGFHQELSVSLSGRAFLGDTDSIPRVPTAEWLSSYGSEASDQNHVREQWAAEPDVGRVAYGVPARVDRLRALGNAVVPQVVEAIGRAIMNTAGRREQQLPAGLSDAMHHDVHAPQRRGAAEQVNGQLRTE